MTDLALLAAYIAYLASQQNKLAHYYHLSLGAMRVVRGAALTSTYSRMLHTTSGLALIKVTVHRFNCKLICEQDCAMIASNAYRVANVHESCMQQPNDC